MGPDTYTYACPLEHQVRVLTARPRQTRQGRSTKRWSTTSCHREKLDVDNYSTWSIKFKAVLAVRGLLKAITGDDDNVDHDQKALALMVLSVRDHHLSMLAECSTVKQAWDALKTTYKAKSAARRMQLRRELAKLTKVAGEPVSKYLARASAIKDELSVTGHKVQDATWSRPSWPASQVSTTPWWRS